MPSLFGSLNSLFKDASHDMHPFNADDAQVKHDGWHDGHSRFNKSSNVKDGQLHFFVV